MRLARRVAVLALAALASGFARADWTLVEERFYTLTLAGEPCGRSVERVEKEGEGADGRFRTTGRIEMRFRRSGQETRIELASAFVETASGEPVEAVVEQRGSDRVRYVFGTPDADGAMRVEIERGTERGVERAGGARESRTLPSVDFLTPREVAAFVAARVRSEAKDASFRMLDVQSGLVVASIEMRRGPSERVAVPGMGDGGAALELPVVRYAVRSSLVPVEASELYDATGRLVSSATPIGLGELVSRLSTKAAADECYARAGFDLLGGTFVPSRPLAREMRGMSAAFEIAAREGALPDLPTEGAQQFVRIDGRRGRVDISLMRASGEAPGDRSDPRWTTASGLIDSDSAEVRALLAEAKVAADARPAAKARALRLLVARHLVRKDMKTAFGSASEAARTRSGDCTEHAVLLAALLRGAGIPSRVASGLVYVPDLDGKGPGWGWHLWTQALVEPPFVAGGGGLGWVDLDATISEPDRDFHPGHILVATSDLSGGAADPAFARAIGLIGGVSIEPVREGGAKESAPEPASGAQRGSSGDSGVGASGGSSFGSSRDRAQGRPDARAPQRAGGGATPRADVLRRGAWWTGAAARAAEQAS